MEFNATLEQLPAKISPADPYVSGVRIGRFKPGVVRLVLDLKAQAKPQVFVLKPVGDYGHRLVLDVYPLVEPADPIMALLDKKGCAVRHRFAFGKSREIRKSSGGLQRQYSRRPARNRLPPPMSPD